jgi:hypothetical protein
MKGMVFTEFFEMVEASFSADMVDDIIDDAQPASGGAYTAVGTYDHGEMVALVVALSERTKTPVPALLKAFGSYLFGRFAQGYTQFFAKAKDAFHFLAGIEDVIHTEVRKLYPDAELPRFDVERHTDNELVLIYSSRRHFEDLAEGLILGCIAHFGGGIQLSRSTTGEGDSRAERFVLTRQG